jgi:MFS family permease
MKAVDQPLVSSRQSSTEHYQTFSTPPPRSHGRPQSDQPVPSNNGSLPLRNGSSNSEISESPLPKKQILVLAMIALAEQTALNSISPYLPDMATSFPEVHGNNVGLYVGTIASAFALAQFATNFFWGWLSDRVGRKPVILMGTLLTASCFVAFGFCKTLSQAIVVQALMGMVNGNQGLVSTCLGEITDRSNQSRAFTYLPVLYGIGGITGPVLGGSLVFKHDSSKESAMNSYPYLLPNLVSAAILMVDFMLTSVFLEESLQDAKFPNCGKRVRDLFSWLWQFTSASRPTYLQTRCRSYRYQHISTRDRSTSNELRNDELGSVSGTSNIHGGHHEELNRQEVFNRDTILLLATYLIFALVNVAFNSLYPIFAQTPEPVGRGLTPKEIGYSLGFSGIVTIIFQVFIFGKLRDKKGNRWTYRAGFFGFVLAFLFMPFVGYKGKDRNGYLSKDSALLAAELCILLLIKTAAAVSGLTSSLLLVRYKVHSPSLRLY